jgi:hypothetical protein
VNAIFFSSYLLSTLSDINVLLHSCSNICLLCISLANKQSLPKHPAHEWTILWSHLPCCTDGGTCPITPGCIALPWPKWGGGYPGGRPWGAKNGWGGWFVLVPGPGPWKGTDTWQNKQTNSMAWICERTIQSERPPLVSEVSANFLRIEGATRSAWRIPTAAF